MFQAAPFKQRVLAPWCRAVVTRAWQVTGYSRRRGYDQYLLCGNRRFLPTHSGFRPKSALLHTLEWRIFVARHRSTIRPDHESEQKPFNSSGLALAWRVQSVFLVFRSYYGGGQLRGQCVRLLRRYDSLRTVSWPFRTRHQLRNTRTITPPGGD
jgi:hypothetical protein